MTKNVTVCFPVLICIAMALGTVEREPKPRRLANVLCAANRIQCLSERNAQKRLPDARLHEELERVLGELRSVGELARLGVICFMFARPGEVGED